MSPHRTRIIILGSTGSIGEQTLDVVRHCNALLHDGLSPLLLEVVGIAAGTNATKLAEQAREFGVHAVALASALPDPTDLPAATRRFTGQDAAEELVRSVPCDLVVAAMVGFAGLPATLAAAELGRDIALANKETLVAAGGLVTHAVRASGSKLLPVDSEHAAAWQCLLGAMHQRVPHAAPPFLPGEVPEHVTRLTLTASGGPFRAWTSDQLALAAPADALKHPTWRMGPKVTIDSATLMNKALELIEAHWLFGLGADRLNAIIHPQSLVHAIVSHADGSSIAQWSPPDMRVPIQRALLWPTHAPGPCPGVDFGSLGDISFEAPDLARFPALALGQRVIRAGGSAGAVLNAANEVAVRLFLEGKVPFPRIAEIAARALDAVPLFPIASLADARDADAAGREHARRGSQDVG